MVMNCGTNNDTIEIFIYSWNHDVIEYENEK